MNSENEYNKINLYFRRLTNMVMHRFLFALSNNLGYNLDDA